MAGRKFLHFGKAFEKRAAPSKATSAQFEILKSGTLCQRDELPLRPASLKRIHHHEETRPAIWTHDGLPAISAVRLGETTPRASRKLRCHSSRTSNSQIAPARSR